MSRRYPCAAALFPLVLATAATPAWSQFAAPPASAAQLPWVSAYKSCAESALMRRFADASTLDPPPPGELVAQAEHDCADRVPLAGSESMGDALVVQTIVATEHRDLMRHFRGSATTVTTVRVAPPPPPTMSLGAGVTCPRPDYPPAAVRALVQGATRVRLTVDADGHVTDGEVVGASGPTREHRLLDNTAAASFRGCQFPKADDGAPRVVTLAYEWRLN